LVPSDPACRLERTLAKYTCLTKNETIRIFYNSRTYDIDVVELKSARGPADAVSIIEADVNVDFDAPADYVEPGREPAAPTEIFIPDNNFSQAAARGCIAIPSDFHLEADIAGPSEPGRTLTGKTKKKKKNKPAPVEFKGSLSQGSMTSELMIIGELVAEGQNACFDFPFMNDPEPTKDPTSPTFEGIAATTLRAAKKK